MAHFQVQEMAAPPKTRAKAERLSLVLPPDAKSASAAARRFWDTLFDGWSVGTPRLTDQEILVKRGGEGDDRFPYLVWHAVFTVAVTAGVSMTIIMTSADDPGVYRMDFVLLGQRKGPTTKIKERVASEVMAMEDRVTTELSDEELKEFRRLKVSMAKVPHLHRDGFRQDDHLVGRIILDKIPMEKLDSVAPRIRKVAEKVAQVIRDEVAEKRVAQEFVGGEPVSTEVTDLEKFMEIASSDCLDPRVRKLVEANKLSDEPAVGRALGGRTISLRPSGSDTPRNTADVSAVYLTDSISMARAYANGRVKNAHGGASKVEDGVIFVIDFSDSFREVGGDVWQTLVDDLRGAAKKYLADGDVDQDLKNVLDACGGIELDQDLARKIAANPSVLLSDLDAHDWMTMQYISHGYAELAVREVPWRYIVAILEYDGDGNLARRTKGGSNSTWDEKKEEDYNDFLYHGAPREHWEKQLDDLNESGEGEIVIESDDSWDSSDGINDFVRTEFTCGSCDAIAYVLNKKFGWKVMENLEDDGEVHHTWVVNDDGKAVDINGVHEDATARTKYDKQKEYKTREVLNLKPKEDAVKWAEEIVENFPSHFGVGHVSEANNDEYVKGTGPRGYLRVAWGPEAPEVIHSNLPGVFGMDDPGGAFVLHCTEDPVFWTWAMQAAYGRNPSDAWLILVLPADGDGEAAVSPGDPPSFPEPESPDPDAFEKDDDFDAACDEYARAMAWARLYPAEHVGDTIALLTPRLTLRRGKDFEVLGRFDPGKSRFDVRPPTSGTNEAFGTYEDSMVVDRVNGVEYVCNNAKFPSRISAFKEVGRVGALDLTPYTVGGKKYLRISSVSVVKDYRRQRIATRMYAAAAKVAKEAGYAGLISLDEDVASKAAVAGLRKKTGMTKVEDGKWLLASEGRVVSEANVGIDVPSADILRWVKDALAKKHETFQKQVDEVPEANTVGDIAKLAKDLTPVARVYVGGRDFHCRNAEGEDEIVHCKIVVGGSGKGVDGFSFVLPDDGGFDDVEASMRAALAKRIDSDLVDVVSGNIPTSVNDGVVNGYAVAVLSSSLSPSKMIDPMFQAEVAATIGHEFGHARDSYDQTEDGDAYEAETNAAMLKMKYADMPREVRALVPEITTSLEANRDQVAGFLRGESKDTPEFAKEMRAGFKDKSFGNLGPSIVFLMRHFASKACERTFFQLSKENKRYVVKKVAEWVKRLMVDEKIPARQAWLEGVISEVTPPEVIFNLPIIRISDDEDAEMEVIARKVLGKRFKESAESSAITTYEHLYHGTNETDEFKKFKTSSAFTDDKELAASYVTRASGRLYEVELTMKNPFVIEGGGRWVGDVIYEKSEQNKRDAHEYFLGSVPFEYDGLIVKNVSDPGLRGGKDIVETVANIYFVRSSSQVKVVKSTEVNDGVVSEGADKPKLPSSRATALPLRDVISMLKERGIEKYWGAGTSGTLWVGRHTTNPMSELPEILGNPPCYLTKSGLLTAVIDGKSTIVAKPHRWTRDDVDLLAD